MSKQITFNTIEDMVDYAVDHNGSSAMFALRTSYDRVWDNEGDGKAWNEQWDVVHKQVRDARLFNSSGATQAELDRLNALEDGLFKVMPPQHVVTKYWLEAKTSDRWHSGRTIELSPELGKLIESVWKLVPSFRGSSSTKLSPAGVSIAGIVKRLGKTDLTERIVVARAAKQAENARRSRNYHRREIEKIARQLIAAMKAGLDEGVVLPVHLSELVDLSEYMEEE